MISFDTNVLVYSTDPFAEKQTAAIGLLNSAAKLDAGLTEQSIVEFIHVATRKVGNSLTDVAYIVQRWLKNFALLTPSGTVVDDTLDLLVHHNLSVWDARLIAVCAANGCDILFSEDMQDNAVYGGVRVIDPFNPRNADLIMDLLGK